MSKAYAGDIAFKYNGKEKICQGSFTFNIGGIATEDVETSSGANGFKEKTTGAMLEGTIIDTNLEQLQTDINNARASDDLIIEYTFQQESGKQTWMIENGWFHFEEGISIDSENNTIKIVIKSKNQAKKI